MIPLTLSPDDPSATAPPPVYAPRIVTTTRPAPAPAPAPATAVPAPGRIIPTYAPAPPRPALAPSIGYGYTPPVATESVSYQPAVSDASSSPNTLPTVTTWASNVSSHQYLIAAVALALVAFVAYRRWRH